MWSCGPAWARTGRGWFRMGWRAHSPPAVTTGLACSTRGPSPAKSPITSRRRPSQRRMTRSSWTMMTTSWAMVRVGPPHAGGCRAAWRPMRNVAAQQWSTMVTQSPGRRSERPLPRSGAAAPAQMTTTGGATPLPPPARPADLDGEWFHAVSTESLEQLGLRPHPYPIRWAHRRLPAPWAAKPLLLPVPAMPGPRPT